MQELASEDILKKKVDTIPQYYILDYLKQNLNINEFKIYLVNRNNIKVVDKNNDSLYFSCEDDIREINLSRRNKRIYKRNRIIKSIEMEEMRLFMKKYYY